MPEKPFRFLTLDEVGRSCGLSTYTIRRYVSEGKLPAVRFGGRVRVSEGSLAAFAESRAVVPVPVVPKGAS